MSDFEPLTKAKGHPELDIRANSEYDSNCSQLNPLGPVNNWGDSRSLSSGQSDEKIKHSTLHWTTCHKIFCDVHDKLKPKRTVYYMQGEWPKATSKSSGQNNAIPAAMQDTMDTELDRVMSMSPQLDLGAIKKQLMEHLNCTSHYVDSCEKSDCPVHQNARLPPTKPLYGRALSHYNRATSVIEPSSLSYHQWQLYEVFDDI